jgi:hypothetical protein
MDTSTKTIDLDKVEQMMRLLMRADDLYAHTTLTRETASAAGRPYNRLVIQDTFCGWISISEDGGVTWDGLIDWDIIQIIQDCTRTP